MKENKPREVEAEKVWSKHGLIFSIFKVTESIPLRMDWYCGYVRFPKRPVKERSYHGILIEVPVYGGITFAEEDQFGMVYGFSCAGAILNINCTFEQMSSVRSIDWLSRQCEAMGRAIQLAADLEDEYLLTDEFSEEREKIANKVFYRFVVEEGG